MEILQNQKQINISANFFGYAKKKCIISREKSKLGDTVWVTGFLGDSHLGLLIKKNKISIKILI